MRRLLLIAAITLLSLPLCAARRRAIRFAPSPLNVAGSLLWIAAHPDDEVLMAPLLGDRCVDAGARCTLLVFTRGEAGECLLASGCSPDLATVRTTEMQSSAALFHADLIQWRFADTGGLDGAASWLEASGGEDALLGLISRTIQEIGPEVIVTFDPRHGSTCHPDHEAVGDLVTRSVQRLASPPALWYLETVAEIGASEIHLRAAEPGDPVLRRFDGARTRADGGRAWEYFIEDARMHPSQFDAGWLALLGAIPEDEQAVFIAAAGLVGANERYADICR